MLNHRAHPLVYQISTRSISWPRTTQKPKISIFKFFKIKTSSNTPTKTFLLSSIHHSSPKTPAFSSLKT